MPAEHPDALHEDESAVKKDSVSLAIATGVYGVSFGALAIAAGLNTWQTMVLSLVLFSGGSQFAVVGVLGGGGSGASAVATSSLLGVRNGIYGLQINQFLRPRGLKRVLAAHLTIDESAAMSVGRPTERLSRVGFWWTGLGVYVMWNSMTFVGTLAGNAMGDPKKYGLDAAAVGAFMALLWPRLGTLQGKLTAALAAVVVGWWYSTRRDTTTPRPPAPRGRTHRRSARMSTWTTVLLASALSFVLKFIGYLVPPRYLEGKRTSNIVALLPVALLTGLVCVQAFVGDDGKIVIDARAAAAVAAVIALLLRAPFIGVVIVAAATAAVIRMF